MYGKLVNNKLKIAAEHIIKGDTIYFDDECMRKAGYKPIVFTEHDNDKRYTYVSTWQEKDDYIEQKWECKKIQDDQSSELFVTVRKTIAKLQKVIIFLDNELKNNKKIYNEILSENNNIIIDLYKKASLFDEKSEPLETFINSDNLEEFFKKIQAENIVAEYGYIKATDEIFVKKEYLDNYEEITFENRKNKVLDFCMIKSNFSYLKAVKNCSREEDLANIHMAYTYAYTLFDGFIMEIVRFLYKYDERTLMSSETITYEEIIKLEDFNQILDVFISKKVEKMEFQGYNEKYLFLEKHKLVPTAEEDKKICYERLLLISEKRNCIVHNFGLLGDISFNRLKSYKIKHNMKIGDSVVQNYKEALLDITCIYVSIKLYYEYICDKFKLLNTYEIK